MSAKAEAKHHREKKNNPHCSLFDVAMRIIFWGFAIFLIEGAIIVC